MLKFITTFLDAANERKLKRVRIALESMQCGIALASKLAEIQIITSQNKCFTCKHKYEKQFAECAIVEANREKVGS